MCAASFWWCHLVNFYVTAEPVQMMLVDDAQPEDVSVAAPADSNLPYIGAPNSRCWYNVTTTCRITQNVNSTGD